MEDNGITDAVISRIENEGDCGVSHHDGLERIKGGKMSEREEGVEEVKWWRWWWWRRRRRRMTAELALGGHG